VSVKKFLLMDEGRTPWHYRDLLVALRTLKQHPEKWAEIRMNGRSIKALRQYAYNSARKMGCGLKAHIYEDKMYLKLKPMSEIVRKKHSTNGLGKVTNDILRNLGK
jgi:hypothetical protein